MGLTKNMSGEDNINYWKKVDKVRKEIDEWPAWKKSIHEGNNILDIRDDSPHQKKETCK